MFLNDCFPSAPLVPMAPAAVESVQLVILGVVFERLSRLGIDQMLPALERVSSIEGVCRNEDVR